MEMEKMRSFREVTRYTMADHKRNEDVRERLGISDMSIIIKITNNVRTFGKNA
jgi:hypothetical protein